MNKKFNVIKLSGFKGVLLILFLIGCLGAGFLIFPGWICMNIWNFVSSFAASYMYEIPRMNITHGMILWAIIALSAYALNKNNFCISFKSFSPSEERLQRLINKETNEISKEILLNKSEFSENFKDEKDKITK